jgi:hypothetical protein
MSSTHLRGIEISCHHIDHTGRNRDRLLFVAVSQQAVREDGVFIHPDGPGPVGVWLDEVGEE